MDSEVSPEHNDQIRELLRQLEEHSAGQMGHAHRVSVYAVAIGERLGLGFEDLVHLRQAASLHDIGKLEIDPLVLNKVGEISDAELQELRKHCREAQQVVGLLNWLAPVLPMILHHHERWDGSGYPHGLAGEEIPLGSRIIAVAESFDVLTSESNWREPVTEEAALGEIKTNAGTQFDPMVVNTFLLVQPLIQPIL